MAKRTPTRTTSTKDTGKIFRHAPTEELVPSFDREEVELTIRAGDAIKKFLAGVPAFFAKARTLELNAKMALEKAKTTPKPKTAEEDETIQRLIKANSVDTKEIEEHWTITSILNGMHKRSVAVRKRGTDAREEAGRLWNALHNGYTEEAKRAAETLCMDFHRQHRVQVRVARGERTATVDVSDAGAGVPERDRQRIFEMFYTTRPGGTGLGLFLARSAVERCGGTIQVLDAEPSGACFRITLPAA